MSRVVLQTGIWYFASLTQFVNYILLYHPEATVVAIDTKRSLDPAEFSRRI